MLQTESPVYATTSEQDEEVQSLSDENADDSNKVNDETKSSKEATESEQSESDVNDDDKDNNDFPSAKQDNDCVNTSNVNSNIPIYIGQDGCKYPCPLTESTDQSNIPVGCPTGPTSTSQPTAGLSNRNTLQSEQHPQQNLDSNPNQNSFVSPTINSDTGSAISTSETPTTTTQKSFVADGKLRGGTTQTGSSIPSLSNDLSKPKPTGSGNSKVEGTSLVPPSQTESSIPSLSLEGPAFLTVQSNFTTDDKNPHFAEICVYTSNPNEIKANPYCNYAALPGMFYTVQASGLLGIKVNTNFDKVRNDCNFYIYPKESKSCFVAFFDFKPRIEAKKERSFKD